jgi:hypothetical protein
MVPLETTLRPRALENRLHFQQVLHVQRERSPPEGDTEAPCLF